MPSCHQNYIKIDPKRNVQLPESPGVYLYSLLNVNKTSESTRMDEPIDVRIGEELAWDKLELFLRKEMPFLNGDFTYAQFPGGHANLTYLLKFGEEEYVLRRPPLGKEVARTPPLREARSKGGRR